MKYAKLNLWCGGLALLCFHISHKNMSNSLCLPFLILGFCIITYDATRVRSYNQALNSLIEP